MSTIKLIKIDNDTHPSIGRFRYESMDCEIDLSLDKIKRFMKMAIEQSKFSKAKKLQVGTLIVNSRNQIVGTGYNGTPIGNDNTCEKPDGKTYDYVIHSELNAVLNSTTNILDDCVVFVTDTPCIKCASVLVQKQIKAVFYMRDYRCDEGLKFLNHNGIRCTKVDVECLDGF